MTECIFCKIADKDAPADIVFASGSDIGIVPSEPIANGHTLLLPKKHFADSFNLIPRYQNDDLDLWIKNHL